LIKSLNYANNLLSNRNSFMMSKDQPNNNGEAVFNLPTLKNHGNNKRRRIYVGS
jgi:hypothetical protein